MTTSKRTLLANTNQLQANYKNAVFDALTQFQFIESLLKECLILSYNIIKERTQDTLDFTYSSSDLNKYALNALCTRYGGITKNKNLVSKIKAKADSRNSIAHEVCYQNLKDRINNISDSELHLKGIEIQKHADEASILVGELIKEHKKLKRTLQQLQL